MFPIRDEIRSRRFPGVVIAFILLNLVVFGWEVSAGEAFAARVTAWGVVPARLTSALGEPGVLPGELLTIFSSMFMHGDLLHFLGNMWFLWIFGDNVEDRFGHVRFVLFYLAAGIVAAVSQVVVDPSSAIPMVGASGAIAGVLGAYLRFYPTARVLAVVPIFIFLQFLRIPALIFLGLWFALQIFSSLAGGTGVAWWAHIAGFVAGFALSFLAPRGPSRERRPTPSRRGYVPRRRGR